MTVLFYVGVVDRRRRSIVLILSTRPLQPAHIGTYALPAGLTDCRTYCRFMRYLQGG